MPITQIPFQDPVAPPEKPQPEQLGLYDTQDWETAYRELDARVPHLLIQLQDDLQRSRKREAVWISIIVHLLVFIALWNLPLIEKYVGWHTAVVVPVDATKGQNLRSWRCRRTCRSRRASPTPTLRPIKTALRRRVTPNLIPKNCGRFWRLRLRELRG